MSPEKMIDTLFAPAGANSARLFLQSGTAARYNEPPSFCIGLFLFYVLPIVDSAGDEKDQKQQEKEPQPEVLPKAALAGIAAGIGLYARVGIGLQIRIGGHGVFLAGFAAGFRAGFGTCACAGFRAWAGRRRCAGSRRGRGRGGRRRRRCRCRWRCRCRRRCRGQRGDRCGLPIPADAAAMRFFLRQRSSLPPG